MRAKAIAQSLALVLVIGATTSAQVPTEVQQLPSGLSIDNGKTRLDFYERIDGSGRGSGRSFMVDVTSPGNIDDLWASATGKKLAGFRSQKAHIDPEALRINASNGVATARDKIKLTFDVSPIKQYQTGEITVCLYQFVKAEKV